MLTIQINPSEWKTPSTYAAEKNITPQAVSNKIARKKLQRVEIKELGLILVAELNATPVKVNLV